MSQSADTVCPHCGEPADRSARCPTCGRLPGPPATPPPAEVRESRRKFGPFIPVTCRVCGTRMYATPEQQGGSLFCPDCRAETPIPALRDVPLTEAPPVAMLSPGNLDDGYEVWDEEGLPPEADMPLIAVVCNLCQTRMHATLAEAGGQIACPDCGRVNDVPLPSADEPPRQRGAAPSSRAESRSTGAAAPPVRGQVEAPLERSEAFDAPEVELPPLPPAPPRWTYLSGVWTFPIYAGVWQRWILLALWAGLVAIVAGAVWQVLGGISLAMIYGVFLIAAGAMLAIWWFQYASVTLLTIVESTAHGNDQVESWPENPWLEGLPETLTVGMALAIAAIPGGAILRDGWAALVSALIFFPPVLLSMLERNTPLAPVSLAVLRTLSTSRWSWIGFYLASGAAACWWLPVRLGVAGGAGGVTVGVVVGTAWLLIYARLLGRLAWSLSRPDLRPRGEETAT